jgi:OmpA-OmpF porin, OOP family
MSFLNKLAIFFLSIIMCLPLSKADSNQKEHPFIRPIPGFSLEAGSRFNDFSSHVFRIETEEGVEKKNVKGRYWALIYENKEGVREFSRLDIIENYRSAALEKGGRILSRDDAILDFSVPLPEGGTSWVHLHTWNDYYELTIVDEERFKKQLTFTAREMKKKLDQEGRVAIYGIHFDFDKADLKVGSEKVLTEMVKLMKDHSDLSVEIQGHTDNVGGREYNLELSARRARTVRSFLMLYGIESARMTVKGYGFDDPVASNDTEEGRALNRRVELKRL